MEEKGKGVGGHHVWISKATGRLWKRKSGDVPLWTEDRHEARTEWISITTDSVRLSPKDREPVETGHELTVDTREVIVLGRS